MMAAAILVESHVRRCLWSEVEQQTDTKAADTGVQAVGTEVVEHEMFRHTARMTGSVWGVDAARDLRGSVGISEVQRGIRESLSSTGATTSTYMSVTLRNE